ncbi:MAG: pilus assembly protein PilP [Pseudomonadota bacterium]
MNTRSLICRNVLTALAVTLGLGGCVSKDMSDLENYVAEVLSRKGGTIEPLPPIKPHDRYLYQSAQLDRRDPFQSFFDIRELESQETQVDDADQQQFIDEIMTHNREELENFELDSLRMVGVIENIENLWGIIRDSQGIVYRVQVGNYMGTNFGKITNIQEDRIELREIIKDSSGRYDEREAVLVLAEE